MRVRTSAAMAAVLVLMLGIAVPGFAAAPLSENTPIDWEVYRGLWLKDVPRATPDEPLQQVYSEDKARAFLDDVSLKWVRQNKCGTCHTSVSYLMARPSIAGGGDTAAWHEVRESVSKFALEEVGHKTGISTIIAGSAVAAFTVGETRPQQPMPDDTRALFDFLWSAQEQDGAWQVKADGLLPFLERDPRYLALMVALAVGYAPGRYYDDPSASTGFQRLRGYLRTHRPDNVHDTAVLLWASVRTPGLLSRVERGRYTKSLLALQQRDGGWSLPSMGSWMRNGPVPNDPASASDGYATSLATLTLCQLGYRSDAPSVRRGVQWIKTHQRESGRWYTGSLFSDGFQNYLSNMATAYAVMALHSCDAAQ